jgi:hypothetical protein
MCWGRGEVSAMMPEQFITRLRNGKTVNCTYHRADLAGLMSAWKYEERFILTWEECRDGDQYNEHAYTRDERHEFDTPEQLLAFVKQHGYAAQAFQA